MSSTSSGCRPVGPAANLAAGLIAPLAVLVSVVGLFSDSAGPGVAATSVRGEPVQLSGHGVYRYDTVFMAQGSRGTDLVTLVVAVPLLVAAVLLVRRQSLRGRVLLAGALTYVLYVYASRALSNAYNELFLCYVLLLSASLFGVVLAVRTAAGGLTAGPVRRGLAAFLLVCAGVTAIVWLIPLLGAAARGQPPELLDTYTTSVTDVLDLGILVPLLVLTAVLLRRRSTVGLVLAAALLVLLVLVAATVVTGTVFQLAAGITFTPGQVVGPVSGFVVLAAMGTVLLIRLLRGLAPPQPIRAPSDATVGAGEAARR